MLGKMGAQERMNFENKDLKEARKQAAEISREERSHRRGEGDPGLFQGQPGGQCGWGRVTTGESGTREGHRRAETSAGRTEELHRDSGSR